LYIYWNCDSMSRHRSLRISATKHLSVCWKGVEVLPFHLPFFSFSSSSSRSILFFQSQVTDIMWIFPLFLSDVSLLPFPSFSLQRTRHIMYASSPLLCSKMREAAAISAVFPKNPRVWRHASSLPLFEKSSQPAHVFALLSAPGLKHVSSLRSFKKQRLLSYGSASRCSPRLEYTSQNIVRKFVCAALPFPQTLMQNAHRREGDGRGSVYNLPQLPFSSSRRLSSSPKNLREFFRSKRTWARLMPAAPVSKNEEDRCYVLSLSSPTATRIRYVSAVV
jgi:hypothetical protein